MNLKSMIITGLLACNLFANPCNPILEEMGELNYLIKRLTEELQESPDYLTMIQNLERLHPNATDTDIDNYCFGHDACVRIYFVEGDLDILIDEYLDCLSSEKGN